MGWIYVLRRVQVGLPEPAGLAAALRGGDPQAPAGVDYRTLAEDYPVGAAAAGIEQTARAAAALTVAATDDPDGLGTALAVWFGNSRPISVHRFSGATGERVVPIALGDTGGLGTVTELIGVRYWQQHLRDPGIVLAYEVARYLAQRGDALVVDDLAVLRVVGGGWQPTGLPLPRRTMPRYGQPDPRPGGPVLLGQALSTARDLALVRRHTTTESGAALGEIRLGYEMSAAPPALPPEILDFLADEALCDGGADAIFLPANWLAAVRRYVGALPPDRASALLCTSGGVRWRYLVDNPVPEVVVAAVDEIVRWPRVTDLTVRLHALYALVRLGSAVVPAASAALAAGRPPQRLLLAAAVASACHESARVTLLELRRDRNSRVRAVARWGIDLLDGQAPDSPATHWCAGCGIADHPDKSICPWCGRTYRPLPDAPWRALGAPRIPVPLDQR